MPPKGSKVIPSPPMNATLEGEIRELFQDGQTDKAAAAILDEKYRPWGYQLTVVKYRQLRESVGLFSTRKQAHTVESVGAALEAARMRFPTAGIRDLQNVVRTESQGMRIPRSIIRGWMEVTEPDQLQARRGTVAKRRVFYSVGANEIWAIDQHDKWKRFGLWLHVGLDVFSGKILWLKVYWTNSNPRLICNYYLEAVSENDGMPLLTHSDPGSENYGVANSQSTLRQMLDPSLRGTMQHRWLRKHSNIKPEIFWSQFRRRAAPGLEDLMQQGIDQGWYDPHSNIEMLTFRYVFMPLIQQELNLFVERYNTSAKRSQTKTSLPAGRPKYIHRHPHQYDGEQLKIPVPQQAWEHVRQLYAPPNHPVFQWIPPQFEQRAQDFYMSLGGGVIVRDNAWHYYRSILQAFVQVYNVPVLHSELHEQGEIQTCLLERSEAGSHRGDAWGYDEVLDEAVELMGQVGEEEFQFDDDETPLVDFSDDENQGNEADGIF